MDKLTFKIGVVIFFTCLSNGLDAAIDASTNNHDGKSFGAQSSPFSPLTDRHIQNGPKLSSDLVKRPANGTPVDIFPPRRFPVAPTVPRFEVSSSEENNIAWPGDYRSMWALSLFRLDRNESEFLLMNVNTNLEVKLLMDGSTLSLGRLSAIDEANYEIKAVSLCNCDESEGAYQKINVAFSINDYKEIQGSFTVKVFQENAHVLSTYSGYVEGTLLPL
tara:strand:+ start:739 stop:1395 length:657 start_codon:yes stop_codon:yes gene_type:complete